MNSTNHNENEPPPSEDEDRSLLFGPPKEGREPAGGQAEAARTARECLAAAIPDFPPRRSRSRNRRTLRAGPDRSRRPTRSSGGCSPCWRT